MLELQEKIHAAGIAVGPGGASRFRRRCRAGVAGLHRLRGTACRRQRGGGRGRSRRAHPSRAPGARPLSMTVSESETIERVLRETHTWAVVGCSNNPDRPSHGVSRTLMRHGYRDDPDQPHGDRDPRAALLSRPVRGRRRTRSPPAIRSRWSTSSATPPWPASTWTRRSTSGPGRSGCSSNVIDEAAAERAREAGLLGRDGPMPRDRAAPTGSRRLTSQRRLTCRYCGERKVTPLRWRPRWIRRSWM